MQISIWHKWNYNLKGTLKILYLKWCPSISERLSHISGIGIKRAESNSPKVFNDTLELIAILYISNKSIFFVATKNNNNCCYLLDANSTRLRRDISIIKVQDTITTFEAKNWRIKLQWRWFGTLFKSLFCHVTWYSHEKIIILWWSHHFGFEIFLFLFLRFIQQSIENVKIRSENNMQSYTIMWSESLVEARLIMKMN